MEQQKKKKKLLLVLRPWYYLGLLFKNVPHVVTGVAAACTVAVFADVAMECIAGAGFIKPKKSDKPIK